MTIYCTSRSRLAIAALAATCTIVGLPAAAQSDDDEAAEDGSRIEEVVVTATRRETNIMETPFAMQVFGGDQLEDENILHHRDLYEHIPGITYKDNAQSDVTAQMRGSGITSVGGEDGAPAIGTYIDDAPWINITSQIVAPIDYFDVQRIEVLRGPQGTSYGQDATAGSIRVYTRDPDTSQFSVKTRLGVTNRKDMDGPGRNFNGVANVPIVEDVLGVRVSLADRYDQGFGIVEGRPDWTNPNQYDTTHWRIKALWTPTENVEARMTYSFWEYEQDLFRTWQQGSSDTGIAIMRPITNRFLLAYYPGGTPENGSVTDFFTGSVKVDLGWAEFQSTTGWMDNDLALNGDLSAAIGIRGDLLTDGVTQEFRLVSKGDAPFQWLAGVYYHDSEQDLHLIIDVDFGAAFNQTNAQIGTRASEARSLYGEVSYRLNDQWVVLAGLRYYEDERVLGDTVTERQCEACSFGSDPDRPDDPLVGFTRDPSNDSYTGASEFDGRTFSYDNWNPRINVTYYPRDGAMVYLNVATGFRAPILHRIQQKIDLELAGFSNFTDYDGTEVSAIEVGTKWTLFDGRLDLEGAIAFTDWKGIPVGVSFEVDRDGDGSTEPSIEEAPIPGGDVRVNTYEVTARWHITDALSMRYTGAYVDGEVTRDESDTVVGFPDDLKKGNALPNTSPRSHAIGLNYSAPFMDTGWQLFGSTNLAFRSKDFYPNPARDHYRAMTGTLGITKGPWTVDLSGQNLMNYDKAHSNASSLDDNGLIPVPRTIMLQVTWDASDS